MDGGGAGPVPLSSRIVNRRRPMRQLGASLYELGSGASAFPRHYHCANEEAIYVLEGEGMLSVGAAEVRMGAGDFAALPRGSEYAHRLRNCGDQPLRYLCFSTMIEPDAGVYPDSNKVGFFAGAGRAATRACGGSAECFDSKMGWAISTASPTPELTRRRARDRKIGYAMRREVRRARRAMGRE